MFDVQLVFNEINALFLPIKAKYVDGLPKTYSFLTSLFLYRSVSVTVFCARRNEEIMR